MRKLELLKLMKAISDFADENPGFLFQVISIFGYKYRNFEISIRHSKQGESLDLGLLMGFFNLVSSLPDMEAKLTTSGGTFTVHVFPVSKN